jgi:penicillin-binding protein 2
MKYESKNNPFDHYPSLGSVTSSPEDYEAGSLAETEAEFDEPVEPNRPLTPLFVVTVVIAGLLGLRLIDLQIVEGTKNRVLAEDNRVRNREIPPPRGEIHDAEGQVLATSQASYSLEIFPAELPRKRSDREAAFAVLTSITGLDISQAKAEIETSGLSSLYPITLASQIDRETALLWEIRLAELAGVSVQKVPSRIYSDVPALGQVLGYVGRLSADDQKKWPARTLSSIVGKTGLEVSYEDVLQGRSGKERIEVDAKGRVERVLASEPPIPGETLLLSLDAQLQKSLASHLAALVAERQVAKAAAVAVDPRTGAILAMVSLPSFDPMVFLRTDREEERLALLQNPDQPLLNRVISGAYPTGSTIKPVIAAAGLAEGTISPVTRLDTSSGVIQIGEWRFPDWKVHGVTDVKLALAESNDIFFYALGGGYQGIPGLGIERLQAWLTKFGFGAPTGIDIPGEVAGLVPSDSWKRQRFGEGWYIGDSYHLAIGQGYFLATPLQLALATTAVANGGELLTPYLVTARESSTGARTVLHEKSVRRGQLVDPAILRVIREGLRLTVTGGTARSLQAVPVPVAGKTGTAQFGSQNETHSWFTGFAPADNPEIVVTILVEGGGESSDAAVPVANRFLTDWSGLRQLP